MSMKSLADLERIFERGLNAWESSIAEKQAARMGQKCVREVKRLTKVKTGNLRRKWRSEVKKQNDDLQIMIENDADYAPYVNNGHRIVTGGRTTGFKEGYHMLEKGIAAYQDTYMEDDLQEMAEELQKAMKG